MNSNVLTLISNQCKDEHVTLCDCNKYRSLKDICESKKKRGMRWFLSSINYGCDDLCLENDRTRPKDFIF